MTDTSALLQRPAYADLLDTSTETQNLALFAQDGYSPLPNLTLNASIRWSAQYLDEHYYPATTAIFRFLEEHGIYPRGRYGAWTYNAMEDLRPGGARGCRYDSGRHPELNVQEKVSEQQGPDDNVPHVSIVIPVYNEEGILRGSVLELKEKLQPFGFHYQLLLCENGSRDRTVEIGKAIEAEHPDVRFLSLGEPNYGLAMRRGIKGARNLRDLRRD